MINLCENVMEFNSHFPNYYKISFSTVFECFIQSCENVNGPNIHIFTLILMCSFILSSEPILQETQESQERTWLVCC